MKIHVLESNFTRGQRNRRRSRRILDFGILVDQQEHPLHVGERLLQLAIDDAEEVERDVELNHERIDQHQIADSYRMVYDAERGAPHDQRHRDSDDRALPDIEQRQRSLAAHRRAFPAL